MIPSLLIWLSTALLLQESSQPSGSTGEVQVRSLDFRRDIQPLLSKHCVSCHGADKQEGGLRLDTPGGLQRGGVSGDLAISSSLESNELYLRVTSTDERTRMPLGKPGLDPSELETLTMWIQQGCPLPLDDPSESASKTKSGLSAGSLLWIQEWFQEKLYRFQFALVLSVLVFASLLGSYARNKQKRKGKLPLIERMLARLTWEKSLFLILVTGLAAVIVRSVDTEHDLKAEAKQLETRIALLRQKASEAGLTAFEDQQGVNQFKPFRYLHPKSIARTYYRGNCERDPKLFNGGNYLTARLKLSLRNSDGVELKYGDELPQEGVVVHFVIERAPGTADMFYDDQKMAGIFLSGVEGEEQTRRNIDLKVTKQNWVWEADFPITSAGEATRKLSGVISVSRKTPTRKNPADAEVHYSLNYDLEVVDGRIDEKSDLWCGCIFTAGRIQLPPAQGMVAFNEWFDWKPIPEIEGENTKDPVLLGLPPDQSSLSPAATSGAKGDASEQKKP